MNIEIYIYGLLATLSLGFFTWIGSVFLRDVSIVDSVWSLLLLTSAIVFYLMGEAIDTRTLVILILVIVWALRLCVHLTWRNWGEPEDQRYQVIRAKYEPNFAFKSLFIIFVFQAVLAWIIAMPLWPALTTVTPFGIWDVIAITLWSIGMFFESVSDWQLARFKNNPENRGKVMDKGLWRYSRHPNYFGESLIWWGVYLFAVSAGAWWTILGPLLITWLLLKFSGVVMLEETIVERRPAYRDYIARTNAFFPGRPKTVSVNTSLSGSAQ